MFVDFSREFDEKFPALLSSPSLESFFRGYNALDADSLIPVVKSGLFRGLRRDLVRLTGRLVDFRGGALEFVRAKNVETWIVSQSWYAEMVAESLIPAGIPSSSPALPSNLQRITSYRGSSGGSAVKEGGRRRRASSASTKEGTVKRLVGKKDRIDA